MIEIAFDNIQKSIKTKNNLLINVIYVLFLLISQSILSIKVLYFLLYIFLYLINFIRIFMETNNLNKYFYYKEGLINNNNF